MNDLVGFSKADEERIRTTFNKLIPYLRKDSFVVVGGLAIRYYLIKSEIGFENREFNDLDIILKDLKDLNPEFKKEFLIYHFHRKDNTFFIPIVDPKTQLKIDIFDYDKGNFYTESIRIGQNVVNISSLEDQLVVTVYDLCLASEKVKRDPKMIGDMKKMLKISDMKRANEIWKKRELAGTVEDAIDTVYSLQKEHPQYFAKKPWRKPAPYECPDCIIDPNFPITPMEEIYKILGYVE